MVECLRAGVPATALYVALGTDADERLTEAVQIAADKGISILEVPRHDLDRIAANGLHQGLALQVPPYTYAHPDDLVADATSDSMPALMVALDNISDPRNLGAIVRSVAAFGGHGVLIPQRRSASVTAVAWRTSAGAAARVPVARATNLTRTLKDWANRGLQVVGLDADGDITIDELDGSGPMVVVVGSEGKGLSRLVRENCDAVVSIPMAGPTESLNASVAAGVVLAEIARQRRILTSQRTFTNVVDFGSTPAPGVTRLSRRATHGAANAAAHRRFAPEAAHRRRRRQQCGRTRGQVVRNRQRVKHFGGHPLVAQLARGECGRRPTDGDRGTPRTARSPPAARRCRRRRCAAARCRSRRGRAAGGTAARCPGRRR